MSKQLKILKQQIDKITDDKPQTCRLNGLSLPKMPPKIIDIEVKKDVQTGDLFLFFCDITDYERPVFNVYLIDKKGNIDFDPKSSLQFDILIDRFNFFQNLEPVQL